MSPRSIGSWLLVITQLFLPLAGQTQNSAPPAAAHLAGYGTQSAAAESAREKQFRDAVVANNIRENMRRLSARPHHVLSLIHIFEREHVILGVGNGVAVVKIRISTDGNYIRKAKRRVRILCRNVVRRKR